jgi:hypothetical protein
VASRGRLRRRIDDWACTAAYNASARSGRRADWKAAVTAERSWQSAWITDRLGLA